MHGFDSIVLFITGNAFLLFVIAFVLGLAAQHMFRKGDFGKAKIFGVIAFMASSLLAVLYLAMMFLAPSVLNLFFLAMWAYFAWSDWRLLSMIPGSRP